MEEEDINGTVLVEHAIQYRYDVYGFLDFAIINYDEQSIQLVDIKTSSDYKFKLIFGRKENRDFDSAKGYYMQIGTYLLGLLEPHRLKPRRIH